MGKGANWVTCVIGSAPWPSAKVPRGVPHSLRKRTKTKPVIGMKFHVLRPSHKASGYKKLQSRNFVGGVRFEEFLPQPFNQGIW